MKIYSVLAASLAAHIMTGCIPTGIPGTGKSGVVGDVDSDSNSITQVEPSPSAPPTMPSTAPANVAPSANAGTDKAITLPTSTVSVTGTASDSDGTITSIAWSKVSGAGTQTFSAGTSLATTISGFSAAGTYVFRITVTDNSGATASDTVSVVVSAAPVSDPATPTNPVPNVNVPVVEGLAPPSSITPCTLEVWKRNVPGTNPSFNNFDTVIYVPCDYNSDANKKYPLVISNHGRGGSTLDTATHSTVGGKNFEGFIKQLRNNANLRATYGAIVLAPDLHAVGDGGDYFPGTAQAHRQARLIIDAIKYLKVDPKRITVTGLSYGGSMTIDMMMMYQELLAGAMPFAMQPPNKGGITAENTCRWVKMPLWAAGKGDDGVFNYYEWSKNLVGGFKYTLERCPGYVTGQYFTLTNTGTGGHTGWDQFYALPEVQNWLMNQVQP